MFMQLYFFSLCLHHGNTFWCIKNVSLALSWMTRFYVFLYWENDVSEHQFWVFWVSSTPSAFGPPIVFIIQFGRNRYFQQVLFSTSQQEATCWQLQTSSWTFFFFYFWLMGSENMASHGPVGNFNWFHSIIFFLTPFPLTFTHLFWMNESLLTRWEMLPGERKTSKWVRSRLRDIFHGKLRASRGGREAV